jgi:hypothetical protein
MVLVIRRLFKAYTDNIWLSVTFVFVVHIAQLPHMFWAADAYLELGMVARVNPILDFILYGIDLLEIPSIINVGILWIYHVKRRNADKQNV